MGIRSFVARYFELRAMKTGEECYTHGGITELLEYLKASMGTVMRDSPTRSSGAMIGNRERTVKPRQPLLAAEDLRSPALGLKRRGIT